MIAQRAEAAWPFSPLKRLAPIERPHSPIFRWRFAARKGDARPWQYVDPSTDQEAAPLYNMSSACVQVEAVTPEVIRDALEQAYEAGMRDQKFGLGQNQWFMRLGYRRCSRKRGWTTGSAA